MREPTLEDIAAVAAILEKAKDEPVGAALAEALKDICRKSYNEASVTSSDCVLGRPETYVRRDGTPSVQMKVRNPRTRSFTGPRYDIDELEKTITNPVPGFDGGQLRWDAVCSIKNMLTLNCNEIPNL